MPISMSVRKVARDEYKPGRVIGLDVSTHVGVVDFWTGADVRAVEWDLGVAVAFDARMQRLKTLCTKLTDLIIGSGVRGATPFPALVVIEGYAMGSKFIRSEQIELAAQARYVCWGLKVPVLEVTPSTLKKFVTGGGRATKDQVMMHVLKRWHFESATNNIADAYGLARIGRLLCGLDKPVGEDAKVLSAIGKPKKPKKKAQAE